MSYTNPNGQLAPSVDDIVLITPLQPTMEMQSSFFGQVVRLDPSGVNAFVRSTLPPNLVHAFSIANEVQFTPYNAGQVRVARP